MRLFNSLVITLVLLVFSGCEDILEVPDISDQTVELLAPLDGTTVTDSTVNFNWNGVADTDAYLVQVATPNFESAAQFVVDSVITVDSTFVGTQLSKTLSNSLYEWRVKALNSGFETPFSNSAFTVAAPEN